ncbi:MAG: AAA family ATPase [Acidimicrobiales bacterium]|nr:AAA family ATPase [Acidimicrobiales bacterium]
MSTFDPPLIAKGPDFEYDERSQEDRKINPAAGLPQGAPDYARMLLTVEELAAIPAPEPLVGSLLDKSSTAVLYGPPGSYKSFIAAAIALCVGSGNPWLGQTTEEGAVIYCAAEGVSGFGQRVAAWQEHEHVDTVPHFRFLPAALPLLAHHCIDAFIAAVSPLEPCLVVMDTLARGMVGGDENSSKDMGTAIRSMDRLRDETGATVLALHHSGKDTDRGMRGSSALLAGVDTVLAVKADGPRLRLVVERQKNHATNGTHYLEALPHGGSLVLTRAAAEPIGGVAPSAQNALVILSRIQIPGGIAAGAWLEATEMAKRTFYDARRRLLDAGFIRNVGTDDRPKYVVTEAGELEVQL